MGVQLSAFFVIGKPGEIPHPIHIQVVWFVIVLFLVRSSVVAVVDVPNQKRHINGENNEPGGEH